MLANAASSSLPTQCALAALGGATAHLSYFIRGEHHTEALRYAQLLVLVPVVLAYLLFSLAGLNVAAAARASSALTAAFLGGVYSSMLVYRIAFHRLGKFPGPFMWRVSKLWHVFQLGKLDNFKQLDKLHQQYGEYVRVGPSPLPPSRPGAGP